MAYDNARQKIKVDLSGRTALITGAGRRLGRDCALALSEAGAGVILHYNQSDSDAIDLANTISVSGGKAWTVSYDLSDPGNIDSFVENAWKVAGGFDILINNASIFPESTMELMDYENLIANITVNTWAPFVLGREMHKRCSIGHIINILDCRIGSYDWKHTCYHASKVLLELFTREMAIKYAPGIAVNAVAPGLILPPDGKDESYLESLKHTVPMDRYGSSADVSDAILYLLSTSFVTGQIIYTDGGRHLNVGQSR